MDTIIRIICWNIILFCGAICAAEPTSDSFCNSRWQAYSRCVQMEVLKQNHPATGLPRPNDTRTLNIQISYIRSCFKENDCKDPLSPEAGSRARGLCFPSTLGTIRNDLEGCVKKNLSNFFLPQDEYSSAREVYRVMFLTTTSAIQNISAYCPSGGDVDATTIRQCLATKAAAYYSTTTSAPADDATSYCDVVSKCKMLSSMTEECNDKWNQLVCPCTISQLFPESMLKYKNEYVDCVTNIGIKNVDRNNDVAFHWFEASLYAFCGYTPLNDGSGTRSWTPGDKSCDISSSSSTTSTQTDVSNSQETLMTESNSENSTTPFAAFSPDDQQGRTIWDLNAGDQTTDQEDSTTTTSASIETTTRPILPWPKFLEDLGLPNPFYGFPNPFSGLTDKLAQVMAKNNTSH